MRKHRLVVCSGASISDSERTDAGRLLIQLDAFGADQNVNVRIEDVARAFVRNITPRMLDLLELASYVYTADASTRRDGRWEDGSSEPWGRDFIIKLPVRDLAFWELTEVRTALQDTLQFTSDDTYTFSFQQLTADRSQQGYLELSDLDDWPFQEVERVCLFSGGLDSLAGAIEMAARREPLVLISHRSVSTIDKRQRDLVSALSSRYPDTPQLHIPVWINKSSRLGQEFSQRTRSFLFGALGCVIATSLRAQGIRFFENGVVSLNLPVADEVLGARASRTTHPHTLALFARLFSLVAGRPLAVDNPYLHLTKTEVVRRIVDSNASDLIELSCSCAHTMHKTKSQWHCGTCSQCIDRRVAVVAAGAEAADPARDYAIDVFTGPRMTGYEQNMAVNYARHAVELAAMDDETIAGRFNLELALAVRHEPSRRMAASLLIDLHKRHAAAATGVIEEIARRNSAAVVRGTLPETSMIALVLGQRHRATIWRRYVDRISEILKAALPTACHSHRPNDEPHLQEVVDGILTGQDIPLQREYPFMRWASVRTKPDWSVEALALWIELKYLRRPGERAKISDAIAADITKYGGVGRKTLFVIYDPDRHLADDNEMQADIAAHDGMFACIIHN